MFPKLWCVGTPSNQRLPDRADSLSASPAAPSREVSLVGVESGEGVLAAGIRSGCSKVRNRGVKMYLQSVLARLLKVRRISSPAAKVLQAGNQGLRQVATNLFPLLWKIQIPPLLLHFRN